MSDCVDWAPTDDRSLMVQLQLQQGGPTAPEEGHALKVVVGIALFGVVALMVIEVIEWAHRIRRVGGLTTWWSHQPGMA
eukprot:COSAG02_NODE_36083_length_459_cov_0.969444_1_plen_78_part_10